MTAVRYSADFSDMQHYMRTLLLAVSGEMHRFKWGVVRKV